MRIGIFGGSFNPPHVCHVLGSIWALETRDLDRVWWIPAHRHAFGKSLVDYEHRRRMCERVLEDYPKIEISDVERELGGESRTIDTVRELEARRPEAEFALIVGSDILEETDEWKNWSGLVDRVDLIVVGRSGYEAETDSTEAKFNLPDVSSTSIRRALQEGEAEWLSEWVPGKVLEYIEKYELYRGA